MTRFWRTLFSCVHSFPNMFAVNRAQRSPQGSEVRLKLGIHEHDARL